MRTLVFLLVLCGFVWEANAQSPIGILGNPASTSAQRAYRICVGGDLQNLASGDDTLSPSNRDNCTVQAGDTCSEPYCTQSPYCKESWGNTGAILMRNMTYSMIGRTDLIDYSQIVGTDPDYSHQKDHRDHDKCDLVLVVGDLQDNGDADGDTNQDKVEWGRLTANHLDILDAAGVPWMATVGNHDSTVKYAAIVDPRLQASPYYYARASDGLSHALLIPTRMGQSLCVIGAEGTAADTAGANATFVSDNIGCGASHPTILMSHELVSESGCSAIGDGLGVADDAGNEEVFLAVGGHTTPVAVTLCMHGASPAAFAGAKQYLMNVNTQEWDRHGYGSNAPYGKTMSDNVGGVYGIVTLDVENDRIDMHAWNPYYQTRDSISGSYTTDSLNEAFDFDTRFPVP